MASIKRYPAGTKGRDIIDSVVEAGSEKNPDVYAKVNANPGYYGQVDIGCDYLSLASVKSKKEISGHCLIEDIIRTAESLKLRDPETASVRILGSEVSVKKTSPEMVAFIKACIAGSYTASEEFSIAVSKYIAELIPMADHPTLPICVGMDTPIGKAVVDELNAYVEKLCNSSGVKHFLSVDVNGGDKKGSIKGLMQSAEGK